MTTLVALLLVGAGSLVYRVVPLLGAARLPTPVSRAAGWAGLSVLTAVTVHRVLQHHDSSIPWPAAVAAVSVGLGLVVAARRRSMVLVLAVGAGSYLALSTLVRLVAAS